MATTRTRAATLLSRSLQQAEGKDKQASTACADPTKTQSKGRTARSSIAALAGAAGDGEQQLGKKRKPNHNVQAEELLPCKPAAKRPKKKSSAPAKIDSQQQQEDGECLRPACAAELGAEAQAATSPPQPHATTSSPATEPMQPSSPSCPQQLNWGSSLLNWGSSFNPACPEHVAVVKNLLSLSGNRVSQQDPAPAGRQQQYQQLHQSLSTSCQAGSGRSVYISGLPGTGKSFTVQRVLAALSAEQQVAPVSVTINCMALSDTRDVYAALLAECSMLGSKRGKTACHGYIPPTTTSLGGADVAYTALVSLLQAHNKQSGTGKASAKGQRAAPMVVLVLEEVDRLLDRGPDELYKLFMLPHTPGLHVALVAIANSLDLTERMLPALKCRGAAPDFVSFPAYSKSQVQAILINILEQLPWKVFEPATLELVARTVSGTSGDLRQAFKVCRTAVDMLAGECRTAAVAAAAAVAQASIMVEQEAAPANDGTQASAPAAAVAPAARATIGLREMMAALRSVSGTSGASASTIATIKALPNQQQLVLLAASLVVAGAEAASTAVRECEELGISAASTSYAVATARRIVNPFAAQPASTTAGAGGPQMPKSGAQGAQAGFASPPPAQTKLAIARATPGTASRTALTADAALRVALKDVYDRYCGLCKELFMRPVALPEFFHTCGLLSEQAMINLAGAGGSTPSTAGRGRAGGVVGQGGKLSLRVLAKDVRAALQSNPIYRKIIGAP